MAFKTQYGSPDACPQCKSAVAPGAMVVYADADRKIIQHADCDPEPETETRHEVFVRWDNLTEESLDRAGLLDQELARVAPLAREGKCPRCNIELPKTRVCGDC